MPDLPKTLTTTNAVHDWDNGPADFALKATVTGAAAGWSLFLIGGSVLLLRATVWSNAETREHQSADTGCRP